MLTFAAGYSEGPIAIRYPRGNGERLDFDKPMSLEPEVLRTGTNTLVIATGKLVKTALEAAEIGRAHV